MWGVERTAWEGEIASQHHISNYISETWIQFNQFSFPPLCTATVPSSLPSPPLLSLFIIPFLVLAYQPSFLSVPTSTIHLFSSSLPISNPNPSLFFLYLCNHHPTFSTYPSLPLLPRLPQWEVHSPPGSRHSSGTGCWSHRGEGWATSGREGSASCPGWPAGCGHGA